MGTHHKHDYFEPDSFGRAVQDTLGDEVMLRLRLAIGGRDVRFPRARSRLLDDHWLVEAMGRADAERLTALLDGETVYIPAPPKEAAYMGALEQGLTNSEIACRLGVTPRQVSRYFSARGIRNPNRRKRQRRALHPNARAVIRAIAAG